MGMIIKDNKLIKITKSKTIHFDLPKDVNISLKHGTKNTMNFN